MIKKKLFLLVLLISTKIISLGQYTFPVENNLNISGESAFRVFELKNEDCAEVSVYYLLSEVYLGKKVKYENILKEFAENFGARPYSLATIEHYLFQKGIKSKILQLKNKEDLFISKYERLILYFPPTDENKLGHFSYAKHSSSGDWNIIDPGLATNKILQFRLDSPLFKQWTGIILLPDN